MKLKIEQSNWGTKVKRFEAKFKPISRSAANDFLSRKNCLAEMGSLTVTENLNFQGNKKTRQT